MMDYFDMMDGAGGGTLMFFAWLTYIISIAVMILIPAALWKYIRR